MEACKRMSFTKRGEDEKAHRSEEVPRAQQPVSAMHTTKPAKAVS